MHCGRGYFESVDNFELCGQLAKVVPVPTILGARPREEGSRAGRVDGESRTRLGNCRGQRPSFTGAVLHGRYRAIGICPGLPASGERELLQEIAASDAMAIYLER